MVKYLSPLVPQRADPFLYKHTDGKYYFTATCPKYDRIEIRCADSINEIATAKSRTVWTRHLFGIMSSHIWAPEIHYIMGKWVIYFAAGELPDIWKIRPFTLICKTDDPMTGEWMEGGMMQAAEDDPYSFTDFSLDMTVFEHKGKWYTIWAQKVGSTNGISNLYIAELEHPTKLKTVQVLLTTPDYDWERIDFWVNEGPAVLKHDGKIYVTPGHNCFVEGDEGEQLCMLHFRNYERIWGDPLRDHNRHAHVMRVTYDESGAPVFRFNKDELYNTPFENEKQKNIN